jgi:hypothetical protein
MASEVPEGVLDGLLQGANLRFRVGLLQPQLLVLAPQFPLFDQQQLQRFFRIPAARHHVRH